MKSEEKLFSVGYSNHDMAAFLDLLSAAGVTALADVRTHPSSQWRPEFNRPSLERALEERGIAYVFLGDSLGGRPDDDSLYTADGRIDYEKVRQTALFQAGLERLIRGTARFTVAMTCGEADPLECHRGLMITPALVERGLAPKHLLADGRVETTEEMESRLLEVTGVGDGLINGLFKDTLTPEVRRELLAEAYRFQARRKGFRRRQADTPAEGS